jgi:hypothetical protein
MQTAQSYERFWDRRLLCPKVKAPYQYFPKIIQMFFVPSNQQSDILYFPIVKEVASPRAKSVKFGYTISFYPSNHLFLVTTTKRIMITEFTVIRNTNKFHNVFTFIININYFTATKEQGFHMLANRIGIVYTI